MSLIDRLQKADSLKLELKSKFSTFSPVFVKLYEQFKKVFNNNFFKAITDHFNFCEAITNSYGGLYSKASGECTKLINEAITLQT